jgi:recombination protein RecR
MASSVPQPIHDAAAAFDRLPGIGPRAALRYAFWLAGQPKDAIKQFARALDAVADQVRRCGICGLWSHTPTCPICSDPQRDKGLVCVVGTNQDARAIEESAGFRGVYHVLDGLIDPVEGRTPDTLNIPALVRRAQNVSAPIREIILAFDPDVAGETTALYLAKQLAATPVSVTRLARGLQNGTQIEYADGTTIFDALENRRPLTSRIAPTKRDDPAPPAAGEADPF